MIPINNERFLIDWILVSVFVVCELLSVMSDDISFATQILILVLQMTTLEEIMTIALTKNKVKFVELLMENGVSMGRYLTVSILQHLYKKVKTTI